MSQGYKRAGLVIVTGSGGRQERVPLDAVGWYRFGVEDAVLRPRDVSVSAVFPTEEPLHQLAGDEAVWQVDVDGAVTRILHVLVGRRCWPRSGGSSARYLHRPNISSSQFQVKRGLYPSGVACGGAIHSVRRAGMRAVTGQEIHTRLKIRIVSVVSST